MTLTRGQAFLGFPGSKPRRGRGLLRSAVVASVFAVVLGQATLVVSLAERDQVTPTPPTTFIKGPGTVSLCGIVSALVAPVIPFGYGVIAIDGQGVILTPTSSIGSLRFGQLASITGSVDSLSVLSATGQAVPVNSCATLTTPLAAAQSNSSSIVSAPGSTQPAAGGNQTQPATLAGSGSTTTTTGAAATGGTTGTTTTTGTGGSTTTTAPSTPAPSAPATAPRTSTPGY
jgi:hypothetical protein